MKLSPRIRRVLLILAALAAGAFLFGVFLDLNPRIAFRLFSNYSLPIGMTVVRSGSMLTDSRFHVAQFWELHHTPEALDEFIRQSGFLDDRNNAIQLYSTVSKAFGETISRTEIVEGYNRVGESRDDWLLVRTNRSISYLITN